MAIRFSRASMALRMGRYRKRFNNHTRMRKLTTCALTVNQSISMFYLPATLAMTWFQNGLAKMRIIETTKQ